MKIAQTPKPPYYAVIFTSEAADLDESYHKMSDLMVSLAERQDGYLGLESSRTDIGITVSYWRDLDCIMKWKENTKHRSAQQLGRERWYENYTIRICRVEREYSK